MCKSGQVEGPLGPGPSPTLALDQACTSPMKDYWGDIHQQHGDIMTLTHYHISLYA